MVRNLLLQLFFFFMLPLLASGQKKEVTIRIVQDESTLLDRYETSVVLKKKSFKIQVLLDHVGGIYAFASFNDSICCRLSELDSIPDFGSLPDRTMAESDFNKEKELLVNDNNSCAYWYYDNDISWKGFNKKIYKLDNDRVVAIKSVKQLYYVSREKEIKLKDVHQPLYLFFVAVNEFDPAGRPLRELVRKKVRIDWIDED